MFDVLRDLRPHDELLVPEESLFDVGLDGFDRGCHRFRSFRVEFCFTKPEFELAFAGLPQIISIIEIYVKRQHPEADYHYFLRELARWFRAEELKNLDEEGVPIQITERFHQGGDTYASLVARLTAAVTSEVSDLSPFERAWVANALDIPIK
ncbi:hypothetical protein EFR84_08015 [Rhizobium chutanense]|uniref:Uncharacterized protein n=1 Tax=Rhizobium chutanense TaxID=2035448 RepID=A0A432P504_9HYPH|nr:hypothetical protein [Rhizobium chutanense]RUM07429.1 hypothetical protein EFR84_08015 [Rhizobium chutanense]